MLASVDQLIGMNGAIQDVTRCDTVSAPGTRGAPAATPSHALAFKFMSPLTFRKHRFSRITVSFECFKWNQMLGGVSLITGMLSRNTINT